MRSQLEVNDLTNLRRSLKVWRKLQMRKLILKNFTLKLMLKHLNI